MLKKLNLVDFLLKKARHLHDLGLSFNAARLFERLAETPGVSVEAAEEIQGRLAEIQFDHGEFRRARRHLAAALAYRPKNPHYHYMMAMAAEADPKCDPERARKHYRRSVALDPEHPVYQADFGLHALLMGFRAEGLCALRQAHRLAPNDAEVLGKVVQGLTEEGEWDEAKRLLLAARFRQPADDAIRQLWERLQFDAILTEQTAATTRYRLTEEARPVILPFRRPRRANSKKIQVGEKFVRLDGPTSLPGPNPTQKKPARKETS